MGSWKTLYNGLINGHNYIKPNPPAASADIARVQASLCVELPSDITELLLEMNGDNWFVFSAEQIVEINLSVRALGCYMPLDCFLFFAGNGCGDYFGYPVTKEDGVRQDNVFMWDHEYDNRVWKASSLEDVIKKYYAGEI